MFLRTHGNLVKCFRFVQLVNLHCFAVEGASTSQEQGPLLRSKVDLVLLGKMDDITSSVKDVKNELGELKIMLGEKLTELIS